MTIVINCVEHVLQDGQTLGQAVAALFPELRPAVAELNGRIANRDDWSTTRLQDGDRMELIEIVGGG